MGSKNATRIEREHMGRCKRGPCMPCLVGVAIGLIPPQWAQRGGYSDSGAPLPMMEFNHCKSGNVRRGHTKGYATCLWHHHGTQRQPPDGFTHRTARERWGPSLFDDAKAFHEIFGSDDDLIEAQAFYLEHTNEC